MKKLILLSSLFAGSMLCAQTTYVAPWQDANVFNSTTAVGGVQVIVDPSSGNVFTVGNFIGSVTIGSFTLTATGGGSDQDIYVAKYSNTGSVVKAVKLGSNVADEAYTLCYRDNFVFVGAYVNSKGTIYKMDDDGTPLDVSITRDLGADVHPRSLFTYGSTSRMLVGGSFISECWLPKSSGSIYLEASNNSSGYCAGDCFDSFTGIIDINAYFLFGDNPNSSTKSNEIMGIYCRNGYIYCTGYFKGDLQWDAGGTTMTAQGEQDAFMASVYISTSINQINYANDPIQAGSIESVPGGAGASDPYWKECGYSICANGTAIYVTGNLNNASTPLFDGSAYTGAGAFIARINYNGSQMGSVSWVRASEDCSSSTAVTNSIGYGIAVDAVGNVWATGRCQNGVELQGGGNADLCIFSGAGYPGFIACYNPSGDILSADAVNQISSSGTKTEGRSITLNGCEIFTTGLTQENSFHAGNLATETIGLSKTAMYIFEISRDAMMGTNQTYCEACASFPNVLSLSASGGTSYSWSPSTYLSSTSSATPTYSLTSCANSGTTNYVCTITNTVTGCNASASVSITAGSTAVGAANAGPDQSVCINTNYTLGTNMPDGLTFYWIPNTYLTGWNTDQPVYNSPVTLSGPTTFTLQVTDVCGNVTYDYCVLSNGVGCPHRLINPDQPNAEVYPNPSAGLFTVNLPLTEQESNVDFVVTDLAGRVVQQSSMFTAGGPVELDLSGQAKGVYMLSVTRDGITEVHKLVIE